MMHSTNKDTCDAEHYTVIVFQVLQMYMSQKYTVLWQFLNMNFKQLHKGHSSADSFHVFIKYMLDTCLALQFLGVISLFQSQ